MSLVRATLPAIGAVVRLAWPAVVCGAAGCHAGRPEVMAASPFAGHTIAVAPALNFSGRPELDPVRVADLFSSEMADIPGLAIVPVSRVVAVMDRQGESQVASPAHALAIARQLGADAIVVLGVTEYDPYPPLTVGLAAQIYSESVPAGSSIDAGALAREARPFDWAAGQTGADVPKRQHQAVYNASHEAVADRIKKYAKVRNADQSPYGSRRYMVSQEMFLRFCCWDAAGRLLGPQGPETGTLARNDAEGRERP